MTNYQQEELENILRNARKGKAHLEVSGKKWEPLDCFIQIIDIVERIKRSNPPTSNSESVIAYNKAMADQPGTREGFKG